MIELRFLAPQRRPQAFVLVLLVLGAMGFFLTWFYLALALNQKFTLSKAQIGTILGSMLIVTSGLSWLGGIVSDRVGHINILRIGMLAYIPITLVLAQAANLYVAVFMILLIGFIRVFTTPATKALCVRADDGSGRMFRWRYIAIVIASLSTGIIGLLWQPEQQSDMLYAGVVCLALSSFWAWCVAHGFSDDGFERKARIAEMSASFDYRPIVALVCYGCLLFILLAQFESSLPLHLNDFFGETRGAQIYRVEIFLGSLGALIISVINDQLLLRNPNASHTPQVFLGMVLVSIAMVMLYVGPQAYWIYIGTVIFATGEVLLFPLIDSMATPFMNARNRGKVMGVLEMRQIGFAIGPVFGGYFLDHSNVMLISFLLPCVVLVGVTYTMIEKYRRQLV